MTASAITKAVAREFGTPVAVVDLDVVERNIRRVQAACEAAGLKNRPHIKTHKSPLIASMQREAGSAGITCQKLGEAEIFVAAGHTDILISYNLMGEEKIDRLAALVPRANLTVAADNPVAAAALSEAATRAGRTLSVVVECDTGRKRAGVESVGEAIGLAAGIAASPGLAFAGFLLYPPENAMAETQAFLDEATAGVRAAGLDPAIVSTGGTPNLANLGRIRGATEHRPGTYVYNDRMMMAAGAATLADCALTIVSTLVSRANPRRGIFDAGSKSLTADLGKLEGYGFVREHPNARIHALAEEHGFADLSACEAPPAIGDVVSIVPNHVCVVVNLMDTLVAVRGDDIVGEIPVAARGRIR